LLLSTATTCDATAHQQRHYCRLAVSNLEFDTPIQRVTQIIGAGSHKVFAESHAHRYQAACSLGCLGLDPALDCDGPLQ
jgi:hypothetical protein